MENTTIDTLSELLYSKDYSILQIRRAFADNRVVKHVFTQCGHALLPYRQIAVEEAIRRVNEAPVAFYDNGSILLGSHGNIIIGDIS